MNAAAGRTGPAMNHAFTVERIIAVMSELAAVMEEETKAVGKADVEAVRGLLKRKNSLIAEYTAGANALSANPAMITGAPEKTRDRFRTAGFRLAEASKKNAAALRGAANATQRLINYIVNTVKDEALPRHGYNNLVEMGKYSPTCRPMAVIRTA